MQVRTSAGTEAIQVGSGGGHLPQPPRTQGPATGPGCDGVMFSKEREVTTASRLSREQRLTERDGECAAASKRQVNRGERENRGESKDATTAASPGRWGKAEVTAVLEKDDKQDKKEKESRRDRDNRRETWKFVEADYVIGGLAVVPEAAFGWCIHQSSIQPTSLCLSRTRQGRAGERRHILQ